MQTIYKYPLNVTPGKVSIEIPRGAQILTVQRDCDGVVCAWVEIDSEVNELEKYTFVVVGTGWDLAKAFPVDKFVYLNTFIEGRFVWHVYYGLGLH